MIQQHLNRYRISGIDNEDGKPWSIDVFAATAEDAWFIAEKRALLNFVSGTCINRYQMHTIDAVPA
jgi:hypothetical protein